MRRSLLILLSLVVLNLACSSGGTKFVGTWVNPDYQGTAIDDVLVIAVSENQVSRGVYEAAVTGHLQDSGVTAYQSITLLPTEDMLTKEQVADVIREKNIDAVIVTRLVDVQEDEEYVPPSTTVYGGYPSYGYPYYGSYYGYYSQSYSVVSSPGYSYTNVTVTLETNLYDASNENIAWSARSATFNPNDVGDVLGPTAKLIVKDLIDEGFVQPKK